MRSGEMNVLWLNYKTSIQSVNGLGYYKRRAPNVSLYNIVCWD